MTGWYCTGNHNGGLCYDSGYHLEPPQKGRGGHRVAWQKHNVVKVFLQPQKAPPFDHNDKHGVKLSQQRRSHYVANYQEFQRNVSLKISSRTNDRIKSEGQLQKDYQNFNSGNKNDLQPQKLHSGWWTDTSKISIIV